MDAPVRTRVLFEGNVQGVGFRYTAVSVARGFQVTGYVRNLPDGRVELVVEGQSSEVHSFLAAVVREMASYIRETKTTQEPPTGEFEGFRIRR